MQVYVLCSKYVDSYYIDVRGENYDIRARQTVHTRASHMPTSSVTTCAMYAMLGTFREAATITGKIYL